MLDGAGTPWLARRQCPSRCGRAGRALSTALAIALAIASCGRAPGGVEAGARRTVEEGFSIGLLLPESKTARYESFDRPLIEKHVAAGCPRCTVLYLNAQQDAAKQLAQADSLLSRGVQVLILDPVDARAAGVIVERAKEQGVPVVAYDRLASGPLDYFVTVDNESVGVEQGKALLRALQAGGDPRRGPIVMLNGAPTDPNAADYKRGAHSVLDGQVTVGFEYDTPDWSPDKAQQAVEQALTRLGADRVIGVYAANDGLASGAIAALKGHGIAPLPPVTGQDAELAAVQRLLAGDQYMTIHKPYAGEAETAAKMALAAAQGLEYRSDRPGVEVRMVANASGHQVPSVLLPVIPVTRDELAATVIADGVYPLEEICAPAYQEACREAGLIPAR